MTNELPPSGRIVTVQTKYLGEHYGYAPPEIFYIAIDDDRKAAAAVKEAQDFAPSDDRLVEVSDKHLTKGSMLALKMFPGSVVRA